MTGIWEIFMLALLIWREARGESYDAQVAVACSVRNRVQRPGWWGKTWLTVILMPEQYSCFNPGDPNATKLPVEVNGIFPVCLAIARDVHNGKTADTTDGATHYFDKSLDANPPYWVPDMTHVKDVGDFHFYK